MSQFRYGGKTYNYNGDGAIDDNGVFLLPAVDDDGKPRDLTYSDLAFFLNYHQGKTIRRVAKLRRYYKGDHDAVRNLKNKASWKPNNKIVVNFPKKLVDSFDGYFAGTPVKVDVVATGDDGNDATDSDKDTATKADQFIGSFNAQNNVAQQVFKLAKETSITGRAFAFLYQGEDAGTSLTTLRSEEAFIIYSMDAKKRPLYSVRLDRVNPDTKTYLVDVNSVDEHAERVDVTQHAENDSQSVELEASQVSYGILPLVEFTADDEHMGLYEAALSLIDGIDIAMSEKANDVSYFGDALLKLINVSISDEEVQKLKDNRVFEVRSTGDKQAEIGFLEKPSNDQTQENLIDRYVNYLYQTTGIVNLDDPDFDNAASGKSLDRQLIPMSNKADAKAAEFTQSLTYLFNALLAFNDLDNINTKIDIKWTKTMPHSLVDESTALMNLIPAVEAHLISAKTVLSQFSFIEDPDAELKWAQEEQQTLYGDPVKVAMDAAKKQVGDDDETTLN